MSRRPREPMLTWEIDRCREQTPTLFSSTKATVRKSVRADWMLGNGGAAAEGLNPRQQELRKGRITLAKVWK